MIKELDLVSLPTWGLTNMDEEQYHILIPQISTVSRYLLKFDDALRSHIKSNSVFRFTSE